MLPTVFLSFTPQKSAKVLSGRKLRAANLPHVSPSVLSDAEYAAVLHSTKLPGKHADVVWQRGVEETLSFVVAMSAAKLIRVFFFECEV